jgi:hypothetical protein
MEKKRPPSGLTNHEFPPSCSTVNGPFVTDAPRSKFDTTTIAMMIVRSINEAFGQFGNCLSWINTVLYESVNQICRLPINSPNELQLFLRQAEYLQPVCYNGLSKWDGRFRQHAVGGQSDSILL